MIKRSFFIFTLVVCSVLLMACGAEKKSAASGQPAENSQETKVVAIYDENTLVKDVAADSAFKGQGRLLFPVYQPIKADARLKDAEDFLTWYNNVKPARTVDVLNTLRERAANGEQIFYDIYSEQEKKADPRKRDTGLWFFRGKPDAPTAIISAGGGFVYVGALQDSFPQALEISRAGYNAFALIYRPGARTAAEDLARAIAFLHEHEQELQISMKGYSLWGGSAGARMANYLGTYGTESFGEKVYPRPAAIIMQYTGESNITGAEPPTYANVGTSDWIASSSGMQNRIDRIRRNGTNAEIEVFPGLPHGFGLGEGTVAEGWLQRALHFWEKNRK